MRKRTLLLLLALFVLLLAGCGSSDTAIISEVSTATEFSMSYTDFTGEREAEISISDSASATVTVALSSKSGSLSVTIADEEGGVVFSANDASGASSYTVKLMGPAVYTIHVDADDHTGSFSFTWEIIGAAVQDAETAEAAPEEDAAAAEEEAPDENAADAPAEEPSEEASEESSEGPAPEEAQSAPEEQAAAGPDFDVSALDWNGIFTGTDGAVSLELWQADTSSFEFAFTQTDTETTLVGVARIDLESLYTAACTVSGTTVAFTWTDAETLEVTTDGTVAALTLDPAGTYSFSEMN